MVVHRLPIQPDFSTPGCDTAFTLIPSHAEGAACSLQAQPEPVVLGKEEAWALTALQALQNIFICHRTAAKSIPTVCCLHGCQRAERDPALHSSKTWGRGND